MLTRRFLLAMSLTASLSSAITLAATLLLFPVPGRAAPDPQAPVATIRTQRLELVTPAGEVRAMLFVHPTGGGALYLRDADTSDGVDISATAGGAGIVLRDATGRVRTGLNAGGMPSIFLTDETGQMIWQVP